MSHPVSGALCTSGCLVADVSGIDEDLGMTTTAADYLWFEESFPELAEAYCFTLVHGLPPAEVLRRLEGREESPLTGAEETVEAAFDLLEADDTRQLVAMTSIGDWTLLIEPNGYLGVTEEKVLPASVGTRWVSHFVNINGVDSFLWAEDGTSRLVFEPGVPDNRWGTSPEQLLEVMHHIGFPFREETSDTQENLSEAAAFALAEHLTSVRITPELLQETTFTCGSAKIRWPGHDRPVPRSQAYDRGEGLRLVWDAARGNVPIKSGHRSSEPCPTHTYLEQDTSVAGR